ncbi:DHA2 family efflux MFS transporter permease subunit [Asticcacaulis sp. BYS171W]|uniref:DHA2 family efflux MFS transporter permease subunit n=1 Tax=Asticcacaulis aquaticus TaxID=2984212 RepID=A0ABT5HTH5_9CAUL|nr:DHA2 family efflux MFS transporter permease subunit [Asticcacaulis aquaticus]MDC7683371.1 DHA2 family efflux MFS transporter permease subunit [Asticcacaulis aquaticus]
MASAPPNSMPAPLTGGALALAAVALALGTFMQVLDSTIANVALPTIAGNLGVASDQGTWVITSFAVANGISVPLTGWLMMRFGVVRTFVVSVALFTLASFLCGIAWNLPSLILFRVLQGAVSGPMIPGSQALLIMIFPPNKRSTALGVWSMTTLVAPVLGPILGGYISDNFAWEWIFLINVPIGIACTWICWSFMRNRETPTVARKLNMISFSLLVFWVGTLQLVLDTGKDADWFSSPQIVILSIMAAIGFIAWLIWELNEKNPVVDLSLFKSRNFLFGVIALCLAYAVFFGNNLLMPLWLQTNMGYVATWAGLAAAPSGMVAVVLTPFVARLSNRIDARILATVSMLLFALSFYMRSLYSPDVDFGNLIVPMFVMGAAMSMFFTSMITLSFRDVKPQQMPAASGLSNFARITAGSFAASLATTLWDRYETAAQGNIANIVHQETLNRAIEQAQAMGMSQAQAVGVMTRQVMQQAYLLATVDIFRISSIIIVCLVPLIWLCRRTMANGQVHAAD